MFGYVRPALDQLSEEEQEAYRGAYCGLCHVMGRRHGFWSRMTLNYDFTFLAILFSAGDGACWEERRCPVHPLRKKRDCLCGAPLDRAADTSILLTWPARAGTAAVLRPPCPPGQSDLPGFCPAGGDGAGAAVSA